MGTDPRQRINLQDRKQGRQAIQTKINAYINKGWPTISAWRMQQQIEHGREPTAPGQISCAARVVWLRQSTGHPEYANGEYDGATNVHAEMAALQEAFTAGCVPTAVEVLYVTTAPCACCAYMLDLLDLTGKVRLTTGASARTCANWQWGAPQWFNHQAIGVLIPLFRWQALARSLYQGTPFINFPPAAMDAAVVSDIKEICGGLAP